MSHVSTRSTDGAKGYLLPVPGHDDTDTATRDVLEPDVEPAELAA